MLKTETEDENKGDWPCGGGTHPRGKKRGQGAGEPGGLSGWAVPLSGAPSTWHGAVLPFCPQILHLSGCGRARTPRRAWKLSPQNRPPWLFTVLREHRAVLCGTHEVLPIPSGLWSPSSSSPPSSRTDSGNSEARCCLPAPSQPVRALAPVQAVGSVQRALPSSPAKVFSLPQYSVLTPPHRACASKQLYYCYLLLPYSVMLRAFRPFPLAFKGNDDSTWTFCVSAVCFSYHMGHSLRTRTEPDSFLYSQS